MAKEKASSMTSAKKTRIISFIFLSIMAFIFIVPILWIILSSFKVDMEINQAGGFLFFPKTWTLDNYKEILNPGNKQLPVYNWYLNSFFISGSYCLLAVFIFTLSAYAYAKMKFKGRDAIFLTMLFLSSFPSIVNIIPMYKIMLGLKWLNTPLALIVPGLAGVFNIFLIRQFMYGIPDALLEAAKIDGAGELTTFFKVVVPLSKPIMIAVGLFTFTGNWNDFLWPSIAINNIDRLTLTAGLQLAKGVYGSQVARMSTIATVSIIPMIILFLFTQRYFMSGISISSGVKG
jgi:multiple sugar transport system permease protein